MKYSSGKNYKVIAVVLACFFRDELAEQLAVLRSEAEKHNIKLVVFSTLEDLYVENYFTKGERAVFDLIPVERFDGVILFSESFKDDNCLNSFVKRAHKKKVRLITIDRSIPEAFSHVRFDYGNIFREICRHMICDHNYKHICYMGGMKNNSYSEERLQIFLDEMKKNNMPLSDNQIYYGEFWSQPCRKEMERMFKEIENGMPMPDAIICANDYMCFTVIDFLNERGLSVPDDIAISGLDGISSEKYCSPRLTTGVIDVQKAVECMFDLLTSENKPQKSDNVILSKLQIGHSCGCNGLCSESTGTSVVHLRTTIRHHLNFEQDVSQLGTSSYGDMNFDRAMTDIPRFLSDLSYSSFCFVVNRTYLNEVGFTNSYIDFEFDESGKFTKEMQVWKISADGKNNSDSFEESITFGELMPAFRERLESNEDILVLPLHAEGLPVGYAVATFNSDNFWLTGYSTFVVNFNHMLEMQMIQFRLAKTYMQDSLTGLLNRNGFYQKIDAMMITASDYELSVISLDMDNLKQVNDTYGHSEGDAALCEIGNFIKKAVRYETAARIGGDEFLIAFIGTDTKKRCSEIVRNIRSQIVERNKYKTTEYDISASIGEYTNVIRSRSFDQFLKKADELMYKEKYMHKLSNGTLGIR